MKEVLLFVSVGICLFCGGVITGAERVKEKMAHEIAVAAAAQGAKDYERLRNATSTLDSVRNDLRAARADADRVRRALARREAAAARRAAGTGAPGCEDLLRDGVELLGSCRERLLECAGRHDALIELVR